jgi:RecA-family ATPase
MYHTTTIGDFLEMEIPETNFIVDKLIPENGITAISGKPGSGKTWLYTFMAHAIASGEDLLGQFGTKISSVLIVDGENSNREIQRRLNMVSKKKSPYLNIHILSEQNVKLDNEESVEELLETIEKLEVDLVIFDPFVAFHKGNENDAGDMQTIMEVMQEILKYGTSIIYIHHHTKDAFMRKDSQSLRGSSALSGRADSHLIVDLKTMRQIL